jgi:CheY-like chemotaxis protein
VPETSPSIDAFPPIVLLLDDERDILEMYSAHFEAEGVWVATAASAIEGMSAVEELRPDVIVTDIHFGIEPSGATFVQLLKAGPETARTPVIVLTGLPLDELPSELRHDADIFLRKPVEPKLLLVDVRRVLESAEVLKGRAGRARVRAQRLSEIGAQLVRSGNAPRAKTIPNAPRGRPCPICNQPLKWSERAVVGGRPFDYYDWCGQGCGLHCFDSRSGTWLRLA